MMRIDCVAWRGVAWRGVAWHSEYMTCLISSGHFDKRQSVYNDTQFTGDLSQPS